MRTMRIGLALLMALVVSSPVFAQTDPGRISLDALIGPSFANVGTTFSTVGGLNVRLSDRMSLVGEAALLPHAPFGDASRIAPAAPAVMAGPFSAPESMYVNAVSWNGNIRVRPFDWGRFQPYLTGGFGGFLATTVVSRDLGNARSDTYARATDPATNLGAGALYRVNDWFGIGADYRTFFVHRENSTPKVHRMTAGVSLYMR